MSTNNTERPTEAAAQQPDVCIQVEEQTPTGRTFEEVILEEERRQERIRFYESLWFWLFIIPLFMITTIGFYWMLTPVQPRQQAVVVRLPDDAGIVAVTPARNRWDAPRVVAIYNKPKKTVKRVILVDEKPPKPEAAEKSKPS